MLTRSQAEAAIYRTAVAAFTYYPGKPDDEPGYTVDEDLDWCMRPLRRLPIPELRALREQIRQLVTEPGSDRQAFIRRLASLTAP